MLDNDVWIWTGYGALFNPLENLIIVVVLCTATMQSFVESKCILSLDLLEMFILPVTSTEMWHYNSDLSLYIPVDRWFSIYSSIHLQKLIVNSKQCRISSPHKWYNGIIHPFSILAVYLILSISPWSKPQLCDKSIKYRRLHLMKDSEVKIVKSEDIFIFSVFLKSC